MVTGVIDVGGGMRGIYAAGIFDYCLDHGIQFDCCFGISAGSANIASYVSAQPGRNHRFYMNYAFRKEYMSLENLLKTGSYINLEYIYGTLSKTGGEDPVDYDAVERSPMEMVVIATEAATGQPHYFTRADIHRDDYRAFMASSCIPGIDRPVDVDGTLYFDGALSDPVPLEKAFSMGCDRAVLILTKPLAVQRVPGKDLVLARMIEKEFPLAAEKFRTRAQRYNEGVARALEYAREGRVLILAPDDISGVDTLKRSREALQRLYDRGVRDAAQLSAWL